MLPLPVVLARSLARVRGGQPALHALLRDLPTEARAPVTYRTRDIDDLVRELVDAGVDAELVGGVVRIHYRGDVTWVRERAWPVVERWPWVAVEWVV